MRKIQSTKGSQKPIQDQPTPYVETFEDEGGDQEKNTIELAKRDHVELASDGRLNQVNSMDGGTDRNIFISIGGDPGRPAANSLPARVSSYPTNKISSTKYNLITFFPLTLFQQLKSVINAFFICNAILQSIPAISTNTPLASAIPVGWVILMGMLFELVSDLRRWRSDRKVNNYKVKRVHQASAGNLERREVATQNLKVGDVIVLDHDDFIPADCIVLSTDDQTGQCFINTSQLDGERNLKPKLAPRMIQGQLSNILAKKSTGHQHFKLEYIQACKDIYFFNGKLTMLDTNQETSLDLKQFIPRGATVKNSTNVYALIVYTGRDTKLVMNQGQYEFAISRLMYQLNIILLINLVIMTVEFLLMSQVGTRSWLHSVYENTKYIFPLKEYPVDIELYVLKGLGSFYLIFNMLIPLDLACNIILVKLFYTLYLEADSHFIDVEKSVEEGGSLIGCSVRNMTKLEDVAQIDHVFCDKTGTLTQNKLIFRNLVFGQELFELDDKKPDDYAQQIKDRAPQSGGQIGERFLDLWRCICLCHDVIQINPEQMNQQMKLSKHKSDKIGGETMTDLQIEEAKKQEQQFQVFTPKAEGEALEQKQQYSGASQDEVTFLEMCRDAKFAQFVQREQDLITIHVNGAVEQYQIIRNVEFTSARKMMSVLVKRMSDGKIINFVKGADIAIIPKILDANDEFETRSIEQMDELASQGLRTLMFAKKEFQTLSNEETLKVCAESELESDLNLLGISALEDLLQENCKDCVSDFRAAKMKVWMLTGDKGETAQNIGISCGIVDDQTQEMIKIQGVTKDQLNQELDNVNMVLQNMGKFSQEVDAKPSTDDLTLEAKRSLSIKRRFSLKHQDLDKDKKECALLISGASLSLLYEDIELSQKIGEIFKLCASIIVYRSSPNDKAQTIKFVMKTDPGCYTLAIGDGANDVNMIQSASIGVGIMGKEGNQAAAFSDYAIPNFQGLRRLLFWHGRRFGNRAVPYLALNLYKTMLFSAPNLWFNMMNGFSGLALQVGYYYALYNILNTVFVTAGFLLLDQDVAFNQNKYVKDAPPLPPTESQVEVNYDPKPSSEIWELNNYLSSDIFDRKELLKQKGISMNSDGSTNNLAQFIWYCRTTLSKGLKKYYLSYLLWAYISGLLCLLVCHYSFGEIIGSDGKINNLWNAGACLLIVNIVSHQIMVWLETFNFDPHICFWYLFSFGLLFVMIWLNDQSMGGVYGGNQWSNMLVQPLYYLVTFLLVFVICLPRYMEICLQDTIFHPEFTKIKGE